MQIKIGTTLYLGGGSRYQLSPPIQGLESPAIRVGDGLYAGRDGGFVSGHFYGHRTIILRGFYIGSNCEEAESLRRSLFGYLRIRYLTPIFIQGISGDNYYTEGYITSVKSDIQSLVSGEYQITILCPDPILYKAETQDESSIWEEHTLPFNNSVSLNNGGNVSAFPVITLQGAIVNPSITNETTQRSLQLSLTAESEDVLVINMEKRLVLLNGVSINSDRTLNSSWWNLLPETNNILLSGDSASLTMAKIEYKKGFVGI